jgi:DNA ligase-1
MKLHTLYKRAVNGKVNEWTIEILPGEGAYRTITGYTDGAKTTTEWTYVEGKNTGRANATTKSEQAIKEAQAHWKKRSELGYFENITDIDKVVMFKPMLANKWEDRKDKVTYPIYCQPKLDGIRCIVKSDGMWTRNGKPIVSAPHIYNSLKPLLEANPDLVFDGELYADKFANDFNAIVSLVKKTKPTDADLMASVRSIEYHIYDLPSNTGTFIQRYTALSEMELPTSCVKVRTDICTDENAVNTWYEEYVGQGYEGQMLRMNELYENKRSNSLLKHKSFIDEEYTIIDIEEGDGNKSGMVGAFVFKNADGKVFNASPKFSWEECKEMLKRKSELIGKSATVKYFNITPDGVPRFPVVINIDRESYE